LPWRLAKDIARIKTGWALTLSLAVPFLAPALKADPLDEILSSTANSQRRIGAIEARKGNYEEALKRLDEAIAKSGNAPDFIVDKIVVLCAAGKYAEALELRNSLPKSYKAPAYFDEAIAKCLCKTGNLKDGIPALEAAFVRNPEERELGECLLSALMEAGQYEKALKVSSDISKRLGKAPSKWCDSYRIEALHARGVELARKGSFDEAIKSLDEALSMSWSKPSILSDKIVCLCWAGKDAEAVKLFESLPPGFETPVYVLPELAKAYASTGEPAKAAKLCKDALLRKPGLEAASKILSDALVSMGQYDEAAAVLKKSEELRKEYGPALAKALHEKGVAFAREGKGDEADKLLAEAATLDKDPKIACDRVVALSWSGKDKEAAKLFESLPSGFEAPPYVLQEAAKSFLILGEPAKAAAASEKALSKDPGSENAAALLFESRLATKDFDGAAKLFEGRPAFKRKEASKLAQAMRDEGVALGRDGAYAKAEALLKSSLELDPKSAGAKADLVMVLSWDGKDEEAIKEFESFPKGAEIPAYVYPALAKSYREAAKVDKALPAFKLILEKDPSRSDAALAIVSILAGQGDFQGAKAFIAERLKTRPGEKPPLKKALAAAMKDKAVALAREGKLDQAIPLIRDAKYESDGDPSVIADCVVLLSWKDLHKEAVKVFAELPEGWEPKPYVLSAAARSFREEGLFKQSAALYQGILKKDPENEDASIGYLVSELKGGGFEEAADFVKRKERLSGGLQPKLASLLGQAYLQAGMTGKAKQIFDMLLKSGDEAQLPFLAMAETMFKDGNYREAVKFASKELAKDPSSLPALRLLADSYEKLDELPSALKCRETICRITKDQRDVDAKYELMERLSAYGLALDSMKADGETPSQGIYDKIQGDLAAERISRRETKAALSILERNMAHASSLDSGDLMRRTRYDSFIADRQAEQNKRVVADYEALKKDGVNPPYWVVQAAADAYLYLRKPKTALELYKETQAKMEEAGLGKYPDNFELRMAFFFTYIEMEDFESAGKVLDELDAEVKPFRLQNGVYRKNWDKMEIAVERAWLLVFQDRLSEAEAYLDKLVPEAATNIDLLAAQAYLHYYRSWPRRSLEDFRIASGLDSNNRSVQVGLAYALDANDEWDESRAIAKKLMEEHPEDSSVQKLARAFEIQDMRTERIDFSYSQEQGQTDGFTLSQRFEQPVYQHSSVYYETVWKHVMKGGIDDDSLPNTKEIFRNGGGVNWQVYRDLTLRGGASIDYQAEHPGGEGGFTYDLDDNWSLSGDYNSYSLDAPGWILLDNGYAQEYSTKLKYRASESFNAEGSFGQMFISDHNVRTNFSAREDMALTTRAFWKTRLAFEHSLSMNSKTDSVGYYSPKYNAFNYVVPYVEHLWYRHYDFSVLDRFFVGPGIQKENGCAPNFAGYLRYEQEWNLTDTISLSAGVTYSYRKYTGDGSVGLSANTSLVFHF